MSQINQLTIIAPNIRSGGGKELLEYLVEYLSERTVLEVLVILDNSIATIKSTERVKIVRLDSVIDKIKSFSYKFQNVLYFGNLPPLVKSSLSMVYFHNPYLVMNYSVLKKSSLRLFLKYSLQQIYINLFIRNIGSVACQNVNIRDQFIEKYKFNTTHVIPFFRLCERDRIKKGIIKYDFCYVSLAHPHKNHRILFEAFEILAKRNVNPTLAVTVESGHPELISFIDRINGIGNVEITNLGLLTKEKVCELYSSSRALIFPSLEETFGLPLIEAVHMDLDVLASDLPYVYQVIEPSLAFNPNDPIEIADKIQQYINGSKLKSKALIQNNIESLISSVMQGTNYV
jgi:glycosyltransferase involved in cell wall biosynthesis